MPKISARGGYFWLGFSLFLLFFTINPLFSQSKPSYKKIYFENLETGSGVRPEIATRVRNQVSLNILRFFKNNYQFIDDSVIQSQLKILQQQQKLGCDTEKCFKMIEDNLSPDDKISGRIDFKSNKFVLTLRLINVNNGGGVADIKEVMFTANQLDFLVGEITRALLDSSYSMNIAGAPAEFEPTKVELGNIEFKEVQGVDLKILKFKSQDSTADNLLSSLSSELTSGDDSFRKKNYEKALESYNIILESIEKTLSEGTMKAIKEYYNGILRRIENTKINLYSEKLKKIDNRFKNIGKSVNIPVIEKYIKEYEELFNQIEYIRYEKYTELNQSIKERISKLELKIIETNEKEAQVLYDNYKFTETLRLYESLQKRVLNSYRIDSNQKSLLSSNFLKKIEIIRETGKSYYGNQIKTYCDLAEEEMLKINLKRLKKESADSSKVKKLLDNARDIIESTRLIDIATLNYYNEKVDSINRSEKLGKKISISDIGSEEGLDESISFSPGVVNILFPGALHIDLEEKVKGNLVRYTFFASLLLYGGAQASYRSSVSSYSSRDNPLIDYLILRNLPLETGFLYYTNQISSLDSVSEDGVRIANAGNGAGVLALGLYLYSWTPAIFGSSVSNTIFNENWKITMQPNLIPTREGILNRELQFGLEGRF